MKAKFTSLLILALSGFTASMAQTNLNSESASPGDYTCGEPNNEPTKDCTPCEESEDPSSSGEDSGPDTGDEQEGNTCPVDSPNSDVNTNTGGVEAKTTDIAMPGATGDLPLSLSRFYQTRDTTANGDLMGHGRTFTHSHSWSMWASGSGGASRSILIPGGNTLQFAPYPGTIPFEGQTAVKYIPQAGFGERLYQVGDWYYLLLPGGERYAFERVMDSEGFTRYFPRNRRTTKGTSTPTPQTPPHASPKLPTRSETGSNSPMLESPSTVNKTSPSPPSPPPPSSAGTKSPSTPHSPSSGFRASPPRA